jgi:hypothetical protein
MVSMGGAALVAESNGATVWLPQERKLQQRQTDASKTIHSYFSMVAKLLKTGQRENV